MIRRVAPLAACVMAGLLLAPVHGASGASSASRTAAPAAAKPKTKISRPAPTAPAKAAGLPLVHLTGVHDWGIAAAEREGIDPQWMLRHLRLARDLPSVSKLMQPPPSGTPKNWAAYRERFIEPRRIEAGQRFWAEHSEALLRAEARWGVPAEIIAAIIGVETFYGRHMGGFRVIDALGTLAFNFPSSHPRASERTAFFRGELLQFLKTHAAAGTDPLLSRGSFAGATGLPQFMPTSLARWGVDFDGDGRIDLSGSAQDAIGSVANYLRDFGWKPGLATHHPVRFEAERLDKDALLAPDILPSFTPASFAAKGAVAEGLPDGFEGPLALIELQNGDAPPSYVAGTQNFYVITRYNWSSYYAMAVIELAQALRGKVRAGS